MLRESANRRRRELSSRSSGVFGDAKPRRRRQYDLNALSFGKGQQIPQCRPLMEVLFSPYVDPPQADHVVPFDDRERDGVRRRCW